MRTVTAACLGFVALGAGPAMSLELHGFVEAAYGVRTADSPAHENGSYTLEDVRAQLQGSAYGDAGDVFVRVDFLRDPIEDDRAVVELREAFGRFTTAGGRLEVKAGRQILTWGTGDLLFINDLFPKDWESFFVGRDDQYLKAPSDAIRLGIFGLPVNADLVVTPRFTEDRLPYPGGRLSLPPPPDGSPGIERPVATIENAEVAARLSRWISAFTVELYYYHGFYKTPVGARAENGAPFHPELDVLGASARGDLLGGIGWVEWGWNHSAKPVDGGDVVPGSSHQYLAGWERQLLSELNLTLQYWGESAADAPSGDDVLHLVTARVEKLLHYQTIRLSFFAYHDPADGDSYGRLMGSYALADDVKLTLGANLFRGLPTTQFGAFSSDDNVYLRLRASF